MTAEDFSDLPFPFSKLMGISITRAEADCVEGTMPVREDLCTSHQILHGGAIMAFADTLGAIGTMVNLAEDARGTATIESKTNFFRGAAQGDVVIGRCTPLHRGRTTQVWQTRIESRDGRAIAMVTQTQIVLT